MYTTLTVAGTVAGVIIIYCGCCLWRMRRADALAAKRAAADWDAFMAPVYDGLRRADDAERRERAEDDRIRNDLRRAWEKASEEMLGKLDALPLERQTGRILTDGTYARRIRQIHAERDGAWNAMVATFERVHPPERVRRLAQEFDGRFRV